jgi:hypothetical protein
VPFFCFPTFYDTKWTETALSLCFCDVDKDYFLTFLTRELRLIEINSLCSCIMATRKSIRQSNTRKRPYERPVNDSDPDFWPKEKLIIKLKRHWNRSPIKPFKECSQTAIHAKQQKQ